MATSWPASTERRWSSAPATRKHWRRCWRHCRHRHRCGTNPTSPAQVHQRFRGSGVQVVLSEHCCAELLIDGSSPQTPFPTIKFCGHLTSARRALQPRIPAPSAGRVSGGAQQPTSRAERQHYLLQSEIQSTLSIMLRGDRSRRQALGERAVGRSRRHRGQQQWPGGGRAAGGAAVDDGAHERARLRPEVCPQVRTAFGTCFLIYDH